MVNSMTPTKKLIICFMGSILLFTVLGIASRSLIHTLPQTLEPAEKFTYDRTYDLDLQYIHDTWVLAYEDDPVKVYVSSDGKKWIPLLPIPIYEGHLSLGTDFSLVHNSSTLGMIWKMVPYDPSGTQRARRCTFMWSTYDQNRGRWSEPSPLLVQDKFCVLNDGVLAEDGTLIVLWEEVEGLGITAYRGVFHEGNTIIEPVMDTLHPFYSMRGISCDGTEDVVWCTVHYRGINNHIDVTTSIDGMVWSDPDSLSLPTDIQEMVALHNGTTGALQWDREKIILYVSPDWDTWEREVVLRLEDPVFFSEFDEDKGILCTGCAVNEQGELLVAYGTKFGIFTAFRSDERYQEQHSIQQTSETVSQIQWVMAGIPLPVLLWMWKRGEGTLGRYVMYFLAYGGVLILISLIIEIGIPIT